MKRVKFLIFFYVFCGSFFAIGFTSVSEKIKFQEKKVSDLERRLIEINAKLASLKDNNAKNDLRSKKGETEIQLEFAEKLLLDLKGIEAKNQLAKANF